MRIFTILTLLLITISVFSQETGTNDFRISNTGTDGDADRDATNPAMAYNSTTDQYLVVWKADNGTTDNEYEIWGQLIDASTGADVGSDFQISEMGPDGDTYYYGSNPDVTYNATDNEFLVVWEGKDETVAGVRQYFEIEIFGQRITAAGAKTGTNNFLISDIGEYNYEGDAYDPKVAWNSTDNEYLVVFRGDDFGYSGGGTTLSTEFEIFGQRLDNTGSEIGSNDFLISDMYGLKVDDDVDALFPDVAYNSTDNEYLVVWESTESLTNLDYEIYAQRIDSDGTELGTNDFVISDMGPVNDGAYEANAPSVAYNATNNEYLIVWYGHDNTSPLVDGENEIFGQRISNTGTELGTNDFRISDMGDDSESNSSVRDNYGALYPNIDWNSNDNTYFVIWYGDDNTAMLNDSEQEIFGHLISNTGTLVESEQRISDAGNESNTNYDASSCAIAYSSGSNFLIAWEGDDTQGSLADNEKEIWGQRIISSQTNNAPRGIMANPSTVDDGVSSGTKVSDLWALDMDMDDSFTYSLVSGTGDTDNGSFTISGTDLMANTTFDYSTKSTYNIRVEVNDGTTTYVEQLTITVNEPITTLVGSNFAITSIGTEGNDGQDATYPYVAYNSTNDEFLVVYRAEHNVDNKYEIFAQRVDPSDGSNIGSQIQVSSQVSGNASYDASYPAVAYNSTDNEYLVVWEGEDNQFSMVDNEKEIFGQRITASTGALTGSYFRISDAGGTGTTTAAAAYANVVYNATNNEYLVVWNADDTDVATLVDGENEIFGQRISATGSELGTNDFRISDMGADGNSSHSAYTPDVDWSSTDNKYLVAWYGDDTNNEYETFGQFLTSTGAESGTDFQISSNPSTADSYYPDVVYNSTDNQFLVVWQSDPVTDDKVSIYGNRLSSSSESLLGSNFLISNLEESDADFDAKNAVAAYNSVDNEYLVAWAADATVDGMVDNEFEIFSQRIDSDGSEIDGDERISENGGTGNGNYDTFFPGIAFSSTEEKTLIVWHGDDNTSPLIDNELEIFGQLWNVPASCTEPDVPTLTASPTTVCNGSTSTISITGNLNDATEWHIYTGSCGGTEIGTTTSGTFDVTPSSPSTTYYIRGEGGCATAGSCGTVTVNAYETFTAGSISADQTICPNTTPSQLTGTAPSGGSTPYSYQWQSSTNNITFTDIPGANSINYQPGSLSATTYYRLTQTSSGSCGSLSTNTVTITAEDNTAPTFTAPADITIYRDAACSYDADVAFTGDVTDEADNCGVGNATYSDVVNSTDPCAVVITRTWSLTDNAGNAATDQVQTITVEDNTPPTFTKPADITIYSDASCNYDATIAVTGDVTDEADNCGVGNATYSDAVNNTDPCAIIITRTWSLTDDCGNTTNQDQIITVEDNIPPTFTAPADITIYSDASCNYDAGVAFTGDVTDEADNCGVGDATYSDAVNTTDPCAIVITRTWSLSDNCGNAAADQIQTITVEDNIAPTFTAPADITIYRDAACSYDADVAFTGDVTDEADNCGVGNATYSDVVNSTDPCAVVITRTWSLSDNCGNAAADQVQTITVEDNTPPTFTTPADITIYSDASCNYDATIAVTGDVTDEADNCGTGEATYSDAVNNTDPCAIIITRTWSLTDDCGNTTNQDQIITIEDNIPPTFTAPADITIYSDASCNYDAGVAFTGDVTNEADNCGVGNATYSDAVNTTDPCAIVITRTWSLSDNCGNAAADQIQTITVEDNIAPTFTAPADITIYRDAACSYDADVAFTGDVTDEADNCGVGNATYSDVVNSTDPCAVVITRTWSLSDNCGNAAADQVQTITVEDNTPPTFTTPADITIYSDASCNYDATIAVTGDVTDEADNCGTGEATYSDAVNNTDPCAIIITRTWSLTDDCGNTTNQDQIITVEDNIPPTFTAPADITIYSDASCNYDAGVAFTGDVTDETDNCGVGNATYSDAVNTTDPCAIVITRTWSLSDNCGNAAANQVQTITVEDNIAPTFTAPADITIYRDAACSYDADVAFTGDVTDETDNCGVGNATYSDVVNSTDPCAVVITRTWSLSDNCGNAAADQVQTITVEDNTPPTFTKPADITIYSDASCNYDATIAVTGDVTDEADNCGVGNATYSDAVNNTDPCAIIITRTWSLTDDCGNTTNQDQIITVEDNIPPTFTAPADITIYSDASCNYDTGVAFTGDVTDEADNCGVGNATYSDVVNSTDPCAIIITRTWSLSDNCGNAAADQFQTITVEDNIVPTFTAPADITIYRDAACSYDAGVAFTGDVTDEADNCGVGNATYSDVVNSTDPCAVVITRTWSLSDNCGNAAADQVQTITVEDNTPPTFTKPADITIYSDASCNYDATIAVTGDVTDEADNCGTGEATYSDAVNNTDPCAIIITRTWSLTDDCGNTTNQDQIITVEDNIPPTFTAPADITIYSDAFCNYDAGVAFTGDVTDEADNCGVGNATYSDAVNTTDPCAIVITRTWSLSDNCGNAAADQIQTITVEDNIVPTFTAPADITIYRDAACSYDADVAFTGDVTDEADNCGVGNATYSDVVNSTDPCAVVITRTWSLTDNCGNAAADQVQTITVEDNTPPTFTAPADITIYKDAICMYDTDPAFTGDVTDENDNCGASDATYSDAIDNSDPCIITITRTWSLVDDCGNSALDQVQTIIVEDNTSPVALCQDISIDLDANGTTSIVAADIDGGSSDNCGFTLSASQLDFDCSHIGPNSVTLTVTDDCGNSDECIAIVTVNDVTAPSLSCPPDQDLYIGAGCEVVLPDYTSQLTATDACGIASITQNPAAGLVYTEADAGPHTIEFIVTDINGNTATCSFVIEVIDQEAFTIDNVSYTDVLCFGANDGTITVNTTGGTSGLLYSIDGVDYSNTTGVFTGLMPGTYTVSVKNLNDCMKTWTPDITITEPSLLVIDDVIAVDVTICAGNSNASIEVFASGGSPAYEYSIDNQVSWQASSFFNNLPGGNYEVFVRDINGCVTGWGSTIHINEPAPVLLTDVDIVHVTGCYGDLTGEIHIEATGGTGNLSYSIDGGATFFDNDGIFTGLAAGFYDIVIVDENNCDYIAPSPTVITQPLQLIVNDVDVTDVTECFGNTNGALDISAVGGTGTILYSIDGGNTFVDNGGLFENLAGGDYNVFITDDNGCIGEYAMNPVTIGQPVQITMMVTSGNVSGCAGNMDGFISISAAGGTGVYTYSIDGGATWSSSADFTGLAAGSYEVWTQDDLGCMQPYSGNPVVITEPDAIVYNEVIVTDLDCFGADNGEIFIDGAGGTGLLMYSIDGGATYQTNGNFTELAAGEYNLVIMDDNGCEVAYENNPVVVDQPNEIIVSDVEVVNESCSGSLGSITITASGGAGNLMYSIDNGNSYQSGNFFGNLPADTYIVKVKDADGCEQFYPENPVTVFDLSPSEVVINANPGTEVCTGTNVELTANAYEAVSYTWSTGETGPEITVNETTPDTYDYTCVVINEDGCESEATISIEFSGSEISISVNPEQGPYCINEPVELQASADNALSYLWQPGGFEDPIIVVTSDTPETIEYTVTVINEIGCETTESIEIDYEICIGVEELGSENVSVSVYPNPNSGEFNLELIGINQEVEISVIDFAGRLILEEKILDTTTGKVEKQFNLSEYERGVYFLRIDHENTTVYKKVVIH